MPPLIKVQDQTNLVETSKYPYASFPFSHFNPVQSRIFDFYDQDCNGVIAAATSSGKTIVGEMFANHELAVRKGTFMYLCPLRALAQEKVDDWTDPTHPFSKKRVSICTGDYRLTPERQKELAAAEVVIMTSEMLNHRCRNHKAEGNTFLQNIGTIVVDECFSEDSIVITDHGEMSVGEIIDGSLPVKVLSKNISTGHVEFRKVTASQKKLLKRKWVTLYYDGGHIEVTSNQLLWVNGGYLPASHVVAGDRVEVIGGEEKKHDNIDLGRGAVDAGVVVGRRVDSTLGDVQNFSKIQVQSIAEARSSRTVEVRKIEASGWHPATDRTERRIRAFYKAVYNSLISGDQGVVSSCLPPRQQESNSSLAQQDTQSISFGCVAYGRRQQIRRNNVSSHGRFLEVGERDLKEVALDSMGLRNKDTTHEGVFSPSVYQGGKRKVFGFDSTICCVKHDVQGGTAESSCELSILWQTVLDFEKGKIKLENMSVLRRQELCACAEEVFLRLMQESVCCDLQVEGNANFFVRHADSSVAILAHNSHLLTVPGRGDHLEVGLMKLTAMNPKCRVVMLSATMPNVDEVAEWISYNLTKRQTYVLVSQYRPCPLTIHFDNYDDDQGSYERKEEAKIQRALDIVKYYPTDKFLIFAHTKRTGERMSKDLTQSGIKNEFHNADLDKAKRISLEKRFKTDPDLRVVVATSTLAWGVNLPSRRVIVLGVHRGMSEVATYDIFQEVGRAGRPAYDPAGDAYILVPASQSAMWRAKLKTPSRIESQLLENMAGNYKLLAFHVVSEIHHGNITCEQDVRDWFERTLAHFQSKELDDTAVDNVIKLLKDCYAIMEEDGKLKATSIGVISSMFYFSPFDVSHLKRNFSNLFKSGKEMDDIHTAVALANIDSNRMGFISRAEREELVPFEGRLRSAGADVDRMTEGSIKAAFMYHCLLAGGHTNVMAGAMRGLQFDAPRVLAVVQALDGMGGKWNMRSYLDMLEKRVHYGVPSHLVELISVPHLGHVRANNLYKAGIKNLEELVAAKPEELVVITKMNRKMVDEMLEDASVQLAIT